jgi:hypothetical protein
MIYSSHTARFEFSSPCKNILGEDTSTKIQDSPFLDPSMFSSMRGGTASRIPRGFVLPLPRSLRNLDLKLQTRQIEIDYARVGPRLFIRKMRLTGKTRVGHVSTAGSISIQVDSSRVQWIPAHHMRRRYVQHARCTRIMTADTGNHLFQINSGRHARTIGIGIR